MLWLADRVEVDRRLIVRAACACARPGLKFIPKGELRPRIAIETAERWVRGNATIEEVRAAAATVPASARSAALKRSASIVRKVIGARMVLAAMKEKQ